jgi:hypothetical protein
MVTMGNQQERSLAWLGGILDGEGSISVQVYTLPDKRVRLTPFVCIVNSDEGILSEIKRILEANDWTGKRKAHNGKTMRSGFRLLGVSPNKKQRASTKCYQFRIDGQEPVYDFLKMIRPYLKSTQKQRNADVIMEYLDLRQQRWLERDALGRIRRAKYTRDEIELISSIRTHRNAKSSEAICRAPNVIG